MKNLVNNWSWENPTEPGQYLMCRGDVESEQNIRFLHVIEHGGSLVDVEDFEPISLIHSSFKFAQIVYSQEELC